MTLTKKNARKIGKQPLNAGKFVGGLREGRIRGYNRMPCQATWQPKKRGLVEGQPVRPCAWTSTELARLGRIIPARLDGHRPASGARDC